MAIYKDVMETIEMLEKDNLDIRTTTMGISLLDCFEEDGKRTAKLIYDKITSLAENLVTTADAVGNEYGINIVNKRISVTPVSKVCINLLMLSKDSSL